MSPDTVFSIASSTAMAGWLLLILAPRWAALIAFIRLGLIGALSLTYAVLISSTSSASRAAASGRSRRYGRSS